MSRSLLKLLKSSENEKIFKEINEIKIRTPLTISDKNLIQKLQQKIK